MTNFKMQTREKQIFQQRIQNTKRLVKFYAGFQNHGVFMWICNRVHEKAEKLHYLKGDLFFTSKKY